ncbi:MAG: O-antigen polymerase [Pedosphaera sp.]|nr:O-antigen polymerase [Pedosphaera sp.]
MRNEAGSKPAVVPAEKPADQPLLQFFALIFGLFLGLSLIKFGNPVVMEKFIIPPKDFYEWLFNPWPAVWGYWQLAGVGVAGFLAARWRNDLPKAILALPLIWLGWQVVAGTQTVDPRLSHGTLLHFSTCVVCFYLGVFALGRRKNLGLFWCGLLAGFGLVLVSGLRQHFGGLEATRNYFFLYVYPQMKEVPPEYLKKLSTNRIFGTLFYPNALAGVILMLLPLTLAVFWSLRRQFTIGARRFMVGVVVMAALGCLYWSGSKGGWLLMLAIGLVAALFLPSKRQFKLGLVAGVLILGLAGFFVKYSGFFKRGATSVVARFDYWQAAVQTAKANPVFGSGPGTFGLAYARIKKPESEMSRVTHNDYLQQASDSGVVGFLSFAGFVAASLVYAYRKSGLRGDWVKLGIWLGLLGWALQGLVEFGLYIPAIAWPAFSLLGWLLAQASNQIDSPQPTG